MSIYQTYSSPLGEMLLVGEQTQEGVALTSVSMTGQRRAPVPHDDWRLAPAAFAGVTRQLERTAP
jgi:methylated-DNA-[protein]-cysteine S-methyltransferase